MKNRSQICIINNQFQSEHDAVIGDHCHIVTGANCQRRGLPLAKKPS